MTVFRWACLRATLLIPHSSCFLRGTWEATSSSLLLTSNIVRWTNTSMALWTILSSSATSTKTPKQDLFKTTTTEKRCFLTSSTSTYHSPPKILLLKPRWLQFQPRRLRKFSSRGRSGLIKSTPSSRTTTHMSTKGRGM